MEDDSNLRYAVAERIRYFYVSFSLEKRYVGDLSFGLETR